MTSPPSPPVKSQSSHLEEQVRAISEAHGELLAMQERINTECAADSDDKLVFWQSSSGMLAQWRLTLFINILDSSLKRHSKGQDFDPELANNGNDILFALFDGIRSNLPDASLYTAPTETKTKNATALEMAGRIMHIHTSLHRLGLTPINGQEFARSYTRAGFTANLGRKNGSEAAK